MISMVYSHQDKVCNKTKKIVSFWKISIRKNNLVGDRIIDLLKISIAQS